MTFKTPLEVRLANYLGDQAAESEALEYIEAVEAGIGAAVERGLRLVEYELANYVNLDARIAYLQPGDFWEGIDDQGQPFREEDGLIVSDLGHSLEFVGLASKFIAVSLASALATPEQSQRLQSAQSQMSAMLERNFANGYIPGPQGISKAFDLISRTHLNADMPWWNLPGTLRAAAYCLASAESEGERSMCLRVFRDCHNAFREFVRPDLHLMAYQTRDPQGRPIAAIPATADADPGYHTGLSLIDTIEIVESFT